MSDVIATWFYAESPEEAGGTYHQVPGSSTSSAFWDVYLRCVAVSLATARCAAPDAKLVLLVNRPLSNLSSRVGQELVGILESLRVEVHVVRYTFEPPPSWSAAWRNQFFVFDGLAWAQEHLSDGDAFLLLDSDVIWNLPAEQLFVDLRADGILSYDAGYEVDHPINGLSRRDMANTFDELNGNLHSRDDAPVYLGGEFLASTLERLPSLNFAIRKAWKSTLERHARGQSHPLEEAHLWSYVIDSLGLPAGNAGTHIKRIWNGTLSHSNVSASDQLLTCWHLPAEKRFGFRRLYADITRVGVDSWLDQEHSLRSTSVNLRLGLPRSSARKRICDVSFASTQRALRTVRR